MLLTNKLAKTRNCVLIVAFLQNKLKIHILEGELLILVVIYIILGVDKNTLPNSTGTPFITVLRHKYDGAMIVYLS